MVEVLPRNNIVLRRLSVQCELLNLKDKFMSKQIRKPKKLIKYYQNNQSFDIPDCKHIIQLYDHIVHSHCMEDFHLGTVSLVRKKYGNELLCIFKQFDHKYRCQLCHHKVLDWSMNEDNQTLLHKNEDNFASLMFRKTLKLIDR